VKHLVKHQNQSNCLITFDAQLINICYFDSFSEEEDEEVEEDKEVEEDEQQEATPGE